MSLVSSKLKFPIFSSQPSDRIEFNCSQSVSVPSLLRRFVLMHLPGKITYKEIDEMIHTVDKNGDGKISYSEFR